MKFSLATLSALGALASSAGALEFNVDDPASIKKATAIVAKSLRSKYTGDRPGDVPGNLPDPYYWWECGAMFNAFVDYWYYTGDDTYNEITAQAMLHQVGQYNAFMPTNQTSTLGNDDQAFWGMAAMSAAENKFPDPPEDEPSWLSLAQGVFNTQVVRWNEEQCGGGLKWQIFTFNNGYNYRNTISNGCFINIAARLAKYTGNETYAEWAEKTWDWEMAVGLMEMKNDGLHFYDGTDDRKNCTDLNHIQWSYNAGVHMAGAAAMWNFTQSEEWRQRLTDVISATQIFFFGDAKEVMFEVACEQNGKCNVDQRSFKAYLSRWMGYTMKVAPWTIDMILPRLKTSAQAAAAQCNPECGLKWTLNGQTDELRGVGEDMAALEVMQNLLIDLVPGPVSEKSGGTSKSDPSAGAGPQDAPTAFNDITTGDKAGAGILTTIVVVGILGGAWWMVS